MKVLFTTNIPAPYRIDFFNELSNYCDLTVVVERKSARNRKEEWTKYKDVMFNITEMKGLNVGKEAFFCPQIIQYIKKNKFDIIVVGGYSTPTGMLLIDYLKRHNIKFILNVDGGMKKETENKIIYNIKKYFISKATYYLSSGKTTDEYLKYYGANEKEINRYYLTSLREKDILKTCIAKEERKAIKEKLGIKKEYIVLGVGSFEHRKGFDELIKATQEIDKRAEVIIVGGTPTKEYLTLINEFKIENIKFIDFLSKAKLEEYYKIADVFVLPTRYDVWGLVINEAMAKGTPIVTTNKCVAGIELVENGKNGFIINTDEHTRLAKKVNEIIKNNKLAQEIRINNLKKIRKYSIENMAKQHYDILKKIIEKGK